MGPYSLPICCVVVPKFHEGFLFRSKKAKIVMDLNQVITSLFTSANQIPGMQGVLHFRFEPDYVVSAAVSDKVVVTDSVTNGTEMPAPDVIINISREDFVAVASGYGDVEQLFAAGKVIIEGDMGLATLLPQVISHALHGPSADDDLQAVEEQRYPAPERYSEVVSAAQPAFDKVDRRDRDSLSPDEFYCNYVLKCRPVIITNALYDWRLFTMSREESLEHFSSLQGIVRSGDYITKTFSKDRDFAAEPMVDFIRTAQEHGGDNTSALPAYMGNNILPQALMALIAWPGYFRRDQYITPRIWIGSAGTVTPLHRDDTDNLFAQVWGEKAFVLAAPHERSRLYAWSTSSDGGLEASDFNPKSPDYEKHPDARSVELIHTRVCAGEILFIPDGWFHHVSSLSLSLSVNFWTSSARYAGE